MKKILLTLVVLVVASAVAFRLKDALKARQQAQPRAAIQPPAPLVEVAQAKKGRVSEFIELVGTLKPRAQVEVLPKISGRIKRMLVDTGYAVRQGGLIAEIEDDEIRQEIRQAEAALEVTRAQLRQREAEVSNLERQLARARSLYEQSLISQQDLEEIETRHRTARAQMELAAAQIKQAEAALSRLRIQLEQTRILAPMDGFVGRRFVDVGQLVHPNTPIVSIVDIRTMVTKASVVEKDLPRVRINLPAEVTVDAYPDRVFSGRVVRMSPVLDPATRAGEVEIELANPTLELKAEMFARVRLNLGTERQALLVPREAVLHRSQQTGVFLLRSEAVKFQPVEVGVAQGEMVEIVSGLKEGDTVIWRGANLLKDGDRVRLRGQRQPQGSHMLEHMTRGPDKFKA